MIYGQKHDFLKRTIKRRIFTLFLGFFWPDINSKKFKNITFRLNSTRAIDWCMNCHIWLRKYFRHFFDKGPPFGENSAKIFSQPNMTIHTPIESPCQV